MSFPGLGGLSSRWLTATSEVREAVRHNAERVAVIAYDDSTFGMDAGCPDFAIYGHRCIPADWRVKEEFLFSDCTLFDCDSSSIVETTPNHLCALWKGGPSEGKSTVDLNENGAIWISHGEADRWSEPQEIVHVPSSVCWDPVLCKLSESKLLLFYR